MMSMLISPPKHIEFQSHLLKIEQSESLKGNAFDLDVSDLTAVTIESNSSGSVAGYNHKRIATLDDSFITADTADGGRASTKLLGVSQSVLITDRSSSSTAQGVLVDSSNCGAPIGLGRGNPHPLRRYRKAEQTLSAPDTSATGRQHVRRIADEKHHRWSSIEKAKCHGSSASTALHRPRLDISVNPPPASLNRDAPQVAHKKPIDSSSFADLLRSRRGSRSAGSSRARQGLPPKAFSSDTQCAGSGRDHALPPKAFSLDSARDQLPRIPVRCPSGQDIPSLMTHFKHDSKNWKSDVLSSKGNKQTNAGRK